MSIRSISICKHQSASNQCRALESAVRIVPAYLVARVHIDALMIAVVLSSIFHVTIRGVPTRSGRYSVRHSAKRVVCQFVLPMCANVIYDTTEECEWYVSE